MEIKLPNLGIKREWDYKLRQAIPELRGVGITIRKVRHVDSDFRLSVMPGDMIFRLSDGEVIMREEIKLGGIRGEFYLEAAYGGDTLVLLQGKEAEVFDLRNVKMPKHIAKRYA
jgi:hypothetical protein